MRVFLFMNPMFISRTTLLCQILDKSILFGRKKVGIKFRQKKKIVG